MKELNIGPNEAGQRLDKLLAKYLNAAPKSFVYKMIRKKNITLNGKKCSGSEHLAQGDVVALYLSDDTIDKFSAAKPRTDRRTDLDILYEDSQILLINKPSGMLSQKAKDTDTSLVEYIQGYLLDRGQVTEESLKTFRPSVCNRLDRNTSGLVAAGKTMAALQILSMVFKDRSIHKYYQCVVEGSIAGEQVITGFLTKDEKTNQVRVHSRETPGSAAIMTEYKPLAKRDGYTLLQVTLITGRTHQIRAHLASIGHPIVGDYKYGNEKTNQWARAAFGIQSQMLHSCRLVFPRLPEPLEYLSGKSFTAPVPAEFARMFPDIDEYMEQFKGGGTWAHGKPGG